MGEPIHVVGPVRSARHWVFLCPVCDDDRVTGVEGAPIVCTTEWLRGQELEVADEDLGTRTALCWETDPFEDDPSALPKNRRFFHYTTIARLLGGTGRRVQLPGCVEDKIQDLYGESKTGFKDNSAD